MRQSIHHAIGKQFMAPFSRGVSTVARRLHRISARSDLARLRDLNNLLA